MTNVQKMSMEKLIDLNQGITALFTETLHSQGRGGVSLSEETALHYWSVLFFQEQLQKEIRNRVVQLMPDYEFDSDIDTE